MLRRRKKLIAYIEKPTLPKFYVKYVGLNYHVLNQGIYRQLHESKCYPFKKNSQSFQNVKKSDGNVT